MHEIEPVGFCTIQEYRRFLERRVQSDDISVDGLYLVLADIRAGKQSPQAFKFPVRAKAVGETSLEAASVTVDLLDLDLQPVQEAVFAMRDGIITNPGIIEISTIQPVREMYFRDYDGFLDLGPGEVGIERGIHAPELVTA